MNFSICTGPSHSESPVPSSAMYLVKAGMIIMNKDLLKKKRQDKCEEKYCDLSLCQKDQH